MEEIDLSDLGISDEALGERPQVDLGPTISGIREAAAADLPGEVIARLACSYFYVSADATIEDVATDLDSRPEVFALGVVEENESVVGLILRSEFFDVLGRTYGREVYKNKPLRQLTKEVRVFAHDSNIFGVAEELGDELNVLDNRFYLMVDARGRYNGIFSTKNILIYLSDITQRDLELARRLQTSIVLEDSYHDGGSFDIAGLSSMARAVGGDFYAYREYAPHRWLIAIFDVSGKGVPASVVTSVLGGMFNAYDFNRGIGAFVKTLNSYIFEHFFFERYLTGVVVDFDDSTGNCLICDMGHSYLCVREEERVVRLKTDDANIPIGISEDVNPVVNSYRLSGGNVLLLFTDGIVEQTGADGEEYSFKRLAALLKRGTGQDTRTLKSTIVEDFEAFRGDVPQNDDVTLLLLQYKDLTEG